MWKWVGGQTPAQLKNHIPEYQVASDVSKEYNKELKEWINNSWLVPYLKKELFMAVVQTSKHKVCLVLDYTKLNEHVDSFTANICIQRVEATRSGGGNS